MSCPSNGEPYRIIVVDDFPAWRVMLRTLLSRTPCRMVGEARNGLEAVSKASQLQPDIVILDIGLPGFNGIEAAKLIRQKCPRARIVFLSQQTDLETKEAALAAGGSAYVLKTNACIDLPRAISTLQDAAAAG